MGGKSRSKLRQFYPKVASLARVELPAKFKLGPPPRRRIVDRRSKLEVEPRAQILRGSPSAYIFARGGLKKARPGYQVTCGEAVRPMDR